MTKRISIKTVSRRMLADVHTPVGIYLRLRDRFRDTILLESSDHHASENSYSFICINAIAGVEVKTAKEVETKLPGAEPKREVLNGNLSDLLWSFMQRFDAEPGPQSYFAQGLYGYFSFEAVQLFEQIRFNNNEAPVIPFARYRLYQYVIAINHHRDELFLLENVVAGVQSEIKLVEDLIRGKDIPVFPFAVSGEAISSISDDDYRNMVCKGIAHCHRGDVFQIVLSRNFSQPFTGDEFNVYRALRSVNPSPYLFYFDYGDYRLMGSSPEAQLIIRNGTAVVHPIAGTIQRTGDPQADAQKAEILLADPKENAEHVMLVDLARNDLSTLCSGVEVSRFREVQYYSHVLHLVSEVSGQIEKGSNPFKLLFRTFPAGTLSGAPKYRAMELINQYESSARGFYGGAIGFAGFDGSCNHAIMIRSMLSRNNALLMQAGAGVVAASQPQNELEEVNNKLNALKKAIQLATQLEP